MFSIAKAHCPGIGNLRKQIDKINFSFEAETLTLACPQELEIEYTALMGSSSEKSSPDNMARGMVQLPFDMKLYISSFRGFIGTEGNTTVGSGTMFAEALSLTLSTAHPLQGFEASSGRRIFFECNSQFIYLESPTLASCSLRDTTMLAMISEFESVPSHFDIPSIGRLNTANFDVGRIEQLKIVGAGSLHQPYNSFALTLKKNVAEIHIKDISWNMETSGEEIQNQNSNISPIDWPCAIKLCVESFKANHLSAGNRKPEIFLSCREIEITLEPNQLSQSLAMIRVNKMLNIEYLGMVRFPSMSMNFQFDFAESDNLRNLSVEADCVQVDADFTKKGWSDALESESSSTKYRLPNAKVSEMTLATDFKGHVISLADAKIHLRAFRGDLESNVESLTKHYVSIVKERIPFLLTKANIAGANVGDSLGTYAGGLAMSSSVTGALVGVVGRDAVGAAISRGKSSRGAGESQRYHFGDFSRGLAASVSDAARSGTKKRGDDQYQIGDFSTHTASAASSYASDNRVRLSTAAGSGVGMAVGLAVAGPLGLVAGSVLGGQAAKRLVERNAGDPSNGNATVEQSLEGASDTTSPSPNTEPFDVFAVDPSQIQVVSETQGAPFYPSLSSQTHAVEVPQGHAEFSGRSNLLNGEQQRTTRSSTDSDNQQTQTAQQSLHYVSPNNSMSAFDTTNRYPGQGNQAGTGAHGLSQPPRYQHEPHSAQTTHQQPGPTRQSPSQGHGGQQQGSYKFGDYTKSMISRGKDTRGKDASSGYKFGDFSRGLFGK